jgi:AbiV family abortive infection protein
MPRERPELSDEQRSRLATACLENVGDALASAEDLMKRGSMPPAAFFVWVAWQEMLKSLYCVSAGAISWKAWWTGYRSHEDKIAVAHALTSASEGFENMMAQFREATIYVEVGEDGEPLMPRDLVGKDGLDTEGLHRWITQIRSSSRLILTSLSDAKPLPRIGETA